MSTPSLSRLRRAQGADIACGDRRFDIELELRAAQGRGDTYKMNICRDQISQLEKQVRREGLCGGCEGRAVAVSADANPSPCCNNSQGARLCCSTCMIRSWR